MEALAPESAPLFHPNTPPQSPVASSTHWGTARRNQRGRGEHGAPRSGHRRWVSPGIARKGNRPPLPLARSAPSRQLLLERCVTVPSIRAVASATRSSEPRRTGKPRALAPRHSGPLPGTGGRCSAPDFRGSGGVGGWGGVCRNHIHLAP